MNKNESVKADVTAKYIGDTRAAASRLADLDLAARLLLVVNDPSVPSDAEKRAWLTEAAARLSRLHWQKNTTGGSRAVTVEGEREEASA